jgi:hypothetical protein
MPVVRAAGFSAGAGEAGGVGRWRLSRAEFHVQGAIAPWVGGNGRSKAGVWGGAKGSAARARAYPRPPRGAPLHPFFRVCRPTLDHPPTSVDNSGRKNNRPTRPSEELCSVLQAPRGCAMLRAPGRPRPLRLFLGRSWARRPSAVTGPKSGAPSAGELSRSSWPDRQGCDEASRHPVQVRACPGLTEAGAETSAQPASWRISTSPHVKCTRVRGTPIVRCGLPPVRTGEGWRIKHAHLGLRGLVCWLRHQRVGTGFPTLPRSSRDRPPHPARVQGRESKYAAVNVTGTSHHTTVRDVCCTWGAVGKMGGSEG